MGDAYRALRAQIAEQYQARLSCPACLADGSLYRLQLVLDQGGATVAADLDVRLPAAPEAPASPSASPTPEAPKPPETTPPPEDAAKAGAATEPAKTPTDTPEKPETPAPTEAVPLPAPGPSPWIWAAGGAALLLLLLLLGLFARRRAARAAAEANPPPEPIPDLPLVTEQPALEITPPRTPPPPAGPVLYLAVVSGQRRGQRLSLVLDGPKTLGRAPGCDLVLGGDPEVSQRHCQVRIATPHLLIGDLGSTNGTRVNGVPIAAAYALADGDLLGIGRTELRVVWTPPPQQGT